MFPVAQNMLSFWRFTQSLKLTSYFSHVAQISHWPKVIAEITKRGWGWGESPLTHDILISNMPWFVPCLLLGFIKINSHSVSACWMKLVEESLHDVIHDVWNSYWSAVKIIFQVFQAKGKRVARGGVPAHLWTRLPVFPFFLSCTADNKNQHLFI